MKFRKTKGFLVILLFLTAVFYPVVFYRQTFFFGDNFTLMVPGKLFAVDTIKNQKVLPFWQPYSFAGVPFLADINQSLFYPSTIFFQIFDAASALNLTVLSHLLIGALGMYALLYQKPKSQIMSIAAGCLWIVAEPTLSWINNFTFLQTGAYMPWLFYLTWFKESGRRWLLPVIVLALLGGHPQPLIYTLSAMALYCLIFGFWKRLFEIIAASIGAVLLTLPVVVPFFEFSQLSTRQTATVAEKVAGSLSPLHLIHWFVPGFFSNPLWGIAWGPDWDKLRMCCGYLSLTVLTSIGISLTRLKKLPQNDRFSLGLIFGSLVFGLIGNIPLLSGIVYQIPLVNAFRNPSMAVFLYIIAATYLLPNIYDYFKKGFPKKYLVSIFVILSICLIGIVLWQIKAHEVWTSLNHMTGNRLAASQIHTFDRDYLIVKNILIQVFLSLLFLFLSLALIKRRRKLSLALIVLDVFLANQNIIFFAPVEIYSTNSHQAEIIKTTENQQYRSISSTNVVPYTGLDDYFKNIYIKPPFGESVYDKAEQQQHTHLLTRKNNLGVNWNQVFKIPFVDGFATMLLQNTADYWKDPNAQIPTRINYIDRVVIPDKRLDDMGVKYICVDKTIFDGQIPQNLKNFPVFFENETFAIMENLNALEIVRFEDKNDGNITMLSGTVNQINFESNALTESTIYVKVTPFPGWSLRIDGSPYHIESDQNGMKLQALTGLHKYQLEFKPTHWRMLVIISLLAWFCTIGLFCTISLWKKFSSQ